MALRKPAQDKFEDMNQDQLTAAPGAEMEEVAEVTQVAPAAAPVAANEPAVAPTPVAQTAVAVVAPRATAVANVNEAAAMAKKFQREWDEMKDSCDFSYGNYQVFKASNGEIAQTGSKESVSLGRWAKVRLLGWAFHHEITPGSQESNTKDFVAYSKDGDVIDSVIGSEMKSWEGKPVEEYLDHLRNTEGFDKASCKKYVDLACALLGSDTGDGPVNSGVIQVTLSPSSIPSFSRYQQSLKDQARCVAMGLPGFTMPEDPYTLFLVREVVAANGNRWSKIVFHSTLPAKI